MSWAVYQGRCPECGAKSEPVVNPAGGKPWPRYDVTCQRCAHRYEIRPRDTAPVYTAADTHEILVCRLERVRDLPHARPDEINDADREARRYVDALMAGSPERFAEVLIDAIQSAEWAGERRERERTDPALRALWAAERKRRCGE